MSTIVKKVDGSKLFDTYISPDFYYLVMDVEIYLFEIDFEIILNLFAGI